MIDFKAIEFFFGKEKTHIISSPLKERKKEEVIQKPRNIPPQIKQPPQTPAPSQKCHPAPSQNQYPAPPQKKAAKKDAFYSEWEKKYKALKAENLLAKKPFKRLALFIVDKKADKAFAEKIYSAVNTRLMQSIFIVTDGSIDELIKEHDPTHIITTKSVTNFIPLPGVLIDDLKLIEKSAEEKKNLWDKLKETLKG